MIKLAKDRLFKKFGQHRHPAAHLLLWLAEISSLYRAYHYSFKAPWVVGMAGMTMIWVLLSVVPLCVAWESRHTSATDR